MGAWDRGEKGSALRRGALFLFDTFIRPRLPLEREEERRHEFILNVLLSASLAFSFSCSCLIVYRVSQIGENIRLGISPTGSIAITILFAFLLWLSRRGHIRWSAAGLLATFFLPLAYALWLWGADLPQAVLAFGMLIVMAGALFGKRASFLMTGMTSAVILLVTALQSSGAFPPVRLWKLQETDMGDAVAIVATFGVLSVVSWLSDREIEKSLHRARISEAALTVERDSLEHKVKERTQELQRLQAEQLAHLHPFAEFGRLASGFFHDLSGPLTAVSLNLERLAQTPALALEEGRQHVDRAFHATKRLEQFLKAVRSQVQQREIATFFSPVDEVTQVLRVLEYRSRAAHVDMSLHTDGPHERAYGNPFNFAKAVTNLIVNALDACETLPSGRPRRIDVELVSAKGQLICRVRDTGPGIPSADLEHVFKPFFTTKPPERGIGIGLSIVKEVAEQDFQGTIEVESLEGKGCVFTLTLPLHLSRRSAHV